MGAFSWLKNRVKEEERWFTFENAGAVKLTRLIRLPKAKLSSRYLVYLGPTKPEATLAVANGFLELLEKVESMDDQEVMERYLKAFEGKHLSFAKREENIYTLERNSPRNSYTQIKEVAHRVQRAGDLMRFTYLSKPGEAPSRTHTVQVKSVDERGFVGVKHHGARRYSWRKVLSAVELRNDVPFSKPGIELALAVEFSKEKQLATIAIGAHTGEGLVQLDSGVGLPKRWATSSSERSSLLS